MNESDIKLIDQTKDYKDCNDYIKKISDGELNQIQYADLFVVRKYDEFSKNDNDLIIAFMTTKKNVQTNNMVDKANLTINNLYTVKQLIEAKMVKEKMKGSKNNE